MVVAAAAVAVMAVVVVVMSSAAAAFAVVVMVASTVVVVPLMVVVAVATVGAVAFAVVVATAASAVAGRVQLVGRGVAHGVYLAVEAHGESCEGMVEIHLDGLVVNLEHAALDHESLLGHHGQLGSHRDLGHELAVAHENLAVEAHHILLVARSEGGLGREGHGELVALGQALHGLYEAGHHVVAHAVDHHVGSVGRGLEQEVSGLVVV